MIDDADNLDWYKRENKRLAAENTYLKAERDRVSRVHTYVRAAVIDCLDRLLALAP